MVRGKGFSPGKDVDEISLPQCLYLFISLYIYICVYIDVRCKHIHIYMRITCKRLIRGICFICGHCVALKFA